MLRIHGAPPGAPAEALRALGEEPFCLSETLGQTTVLLDMGSGAETATLAARLRAQLPGAENLAVLAAICRTSDAIPPVLQAVESAGVPVHHLLRCAPGLLMIVNDSQYETALRSASVSK